MKQFSAFWALCFGLICSANAQFTNQFVTYSAGNINSLAFTGNNFKCIAVGAKNQIWAGTQYQGLYKFDDSLKVWTKSDLLSNVFINDIKRDANGGIWIAQSGTSGTVGGGSNTAGGINYFPEQYDLGMQFYSVPGTTTGGGLTSRNVRSIYVDTTVPNAAANLPRVWAAQATYITSGNTTAGGISIGLNAAANYFTKRVAGLQFLATPSCDAVAGNASEVWVSVRQNFGKSQILRYNPAKTLAEGAYLGYYDNTNVAQLPAGFRAQAMFFDKEGRQWVGLQNGGMVVKQGSNWTTVNMPDIFPVGVSINNNSIAADEYGDIFIGTNNGLVVFNGGGLVDNSTFYQRLTTTDGLPSNNITGLAYDKKNGQVLITSDAGVTFWKLKYKIDVTMQWDNSFPEKTENPYGVAADGVSRIYIKVKKANDTLPDIKEVKVSVANYSATQATLRGRLKNAEYLSATTDLYSEEANDASLTEVSRTDANVIAGDGSFWFWYRSPEDFSDDSLSQFAGLPQRYDSLKVRVTYKNDVKDSIIFRIRVVRPPLLMVHGLASGPSTWSDFVYNGGIRYVDGPAFKYKRALVMDGKGSFIQNGKLLLAGDLAIDTAKDRLNTLQGNIEQLRAMGYAANQVDYVCHSMGGIMIREAIGLYHDKFYASAGNKYKNYGKGFTHKIITINTPHNSSPIADAVDEFIPQAPGFLVDFLGGLYNVIPNEQQPFDFIEPVISGDKYVSFKATPAVKNLQITDYRFGTRAGINLPATHARHHMIVGDINWTSEVAGETAANFDVTLKLVNNLITIMRDLESTPASVKVFLNGLLALGNGARLYTFWEWYSRDKGFPNFMGDGDVIVPLASETARIPLPGSRTYMSLFEGTSANHAFQWPNNIVTRRDVGQKVFNLLNSKVSSNLFADDIPENTDPNPSPELHTLKSNAQQSANPVQNSVSTVYDTTKIKIDLPANGAALFADSVISIKFRLKDTAKLAYVRIHVQDADSFSLKKTKLQQTVVHTLQKTFTGNQKIWAVAAYDNASGGTDYYIDTLGIIVGNNAVVQGFRIIDEPITVKGSSPYFPHYQALYNGVWTDIANNDPAIGVTFEPTGFIDVNATNKAFTALQEGEVSTLFSYKGFLDTAIIQAILPYNSGCINKTIAAGSFKNPAIWSKGVVPDVCDSVIIQHAVTADTSVQFSSLRINSGASLTLTNAAIKLTLGQADDGTSMIDNYGTLAISNGTIAVQGRIKFNAASAFNMNGGSLIIDGNTGMEQTALPDGLSLFEAMAGMQAFNFSAGTLQIIDPPLGATSQSINSAYDFGAASTLVFGNGVSTTASNNAGGFGGTLFPNKIGKLVVDATIRTGNRQFITKKALTVKGSVQVKAGSGVVQESSLRVEQ